jgi:hypothetical protein
MDTHCALPCDVALGLDSNYAKQCDVEAPSCPLMSLSAFQSWIRRQSSQRAAAERLGVSRGAVVGYLNGSIRPSATVLILARLLDEGTWS